MQIICSIQKGFKSCTRGPTKRLTFLQREYIAYCLERRNGIGDFKIFACVRQSQATFKYFEVEVIPPPQQFEISVFSDVSDILQDWEMTLDSDPLSGSPVLKITSVPALPRLLPSPKWNSDFNVFWLFQFPATFFLAPLTVRGIIMM